MILWLIGGGVFLILVGVYNILAPHRGRNYVSPREWQNDPERAKRKQEESALFMGCVLCLVGVALVVGGLIL